VLLQATNVRLELYFYFCLARLLYSILRLVCFHQVHSALSLSLSNELVLTALILLTELVLTVLVFLAEIVLTVLLFLAARVPTVLTLLTETVLTVLMLLL
jgi:hypothetical protein